MKLVLFCALGMFMQASVAFASKARMAVVGTAVSLPDDFQEFFQNPVKVFSVPSQLGIEFGPRPEAGVLFGNETRKFAISLGHRDEFFDQLVTDAGNGLLQEQNPVEIFYGRANESFAWALSLTASRARDRVLKGGVEGSGLRGGARFGDFEVYLHAGLGAKSEVEGLILARVDSHVRVGGEYHSGELSYFFDAESAKGRIQPSGGAEFPRQSDAVSFGIEQIQEDAETFFFYGAKLTNTQMKKDPAIAVTLRLPFYFGIESKMAAGFQWRTLLQQSLLLNTRKDDPGTGAPATVHTDGLNDTAASLGASYQFASVRIDGTLSAATTGTLTTDNLIATMSLTHLF